MTLGSLTNRNDPFRDDANGDVQQVMTDHWGRRRVADVTMSDRMMLNGTQRVDGARTVRKVLRMWRRHIVLFSLVFLLVLAVGLAVLFVLRPSYTATATVAISTQDADPLAPSGQQPVDRLEDDRPATEAAMLQSRDVAAAVLLQYPPEDEGGLHLRAKLCKAGVSFLCPPPDLSTPDQKHQAQIDAFLASLTAVPELHSRVIDVTVKARTGQRAADLADAVVANYQQISLARQTADINRVARWLDARTDQLRQRWLDSVHKAKDFDVAHNLTNTNEGSTANPLIDKQIGEIASNLSEAEGRLAAANARSQALRDAASHSNSGAVIALSQQPILVATATTLLQQESQRDQLAAKFGPSYPGIQALDRQIASTRASLGAATGGALASIREDAIAAQAEVNQLSGVLAHLRAQAGQQGGPQVEYSSLAQEAQSARTVYENFLDHAKAVVDRAALLEPPVIVISHASAPSQPTFPNHLKLGLGVLVVALMAGAAAVLLRSYLSTGFSEINDLREITRLPMLAAIPIITAKRGRSVLRHVQQEPSSRISEIVRGVAAQLSLIASGSSAPHSILITSASPQEGKSTLAFWLGLTIRQGGNRVMLIDTDHRRGSLRETLHGREKCAGFTDLLSGRASLQDVIQSDPDTGIDFISAGNSIAHPFNIGDIERLRLMISTLKQTYSTIIVDSPPMLATSDALVYARIVDSTVFVCRWQHSSRQAVTTSLDRLRAFGGALSGIVVSMVGSKSPQTLGDDYSSRELALINQFYGR